jgi:ABC-type sugar transport system ATPase subunit
MNVFAPSNTVSNLNIKPHAAFVGCRPEHLELVPQGAGNADAAVRVKEQLGGESLLYLILSDESEIVARVAGDDDTEVGQIVGVRIPELRLHQFGADELAL